MLITEVTSAEYMRHNRKL